MQEIVQMPVFKNFYKDDFHFACVRGCGKCCNSPPELSLFDGFRFFRDFPLSFKVTLIPFHDNPQALRWLELGGVRVRVGYVDFVAYASFVPLYRISAHCCPKLAANGDCSIYDRRPDMCKSVPLRVSAPSCMFRQSMDSIVKEGIEKRGYLCDISPDAPVLFHGNDLVEESSAAKGLRACEENYSRSPGLTSHILSPFFEAFLKNERNVPETILNLDIPPIVVFNFAKSFCSVVIGEDALPDDVSEEDLSLVSETDFSQIKSAQEALLQDLIDENLRVKDKDDRSVTKVARSLLETWKRGEVFKSSMEKD